jgi:hypothetical protein
MTQVEEGTFLRKYLCDSNEDRNRIHRRVFENFLG